MNIKGGGKGAKWEQDPFSDFLNMSTGDQQLIPRDAQNIFA